MTEAIDGAQLEKALAMIDRSLGDLLQRELVASGEMADILLDLRSILTFVPAEPTTTEPAAVN